MGYEINDTSAYHIHELDTLGWELTVCNALDPQDSPCRRILKRNGSYGHHLYDFLDRFIPMQDLKTVIEIGGGYGYLMRDILNKNKTLQVTMLDISPYLLQKQRHTLGPFDVRFVQADIMEVQDRELKSYDLAILNEFLGDLPTLIDVPADALASSRQNPDPLLERVRNIFHRYDLGVPEDGRMNVNIGALIVLEKLCRASIPGIFIGEHSCEAVVPKSWQHFVQLQPTGKPQLIRLRGHDEYTIRFTDLEKIACAFQYRVVRGPFADFLAFDFTDKLRYKMASKSTHSAEHEIIQHFIEDLYQYEYLILARGRDATVAA